MAVTPLIRTPNEQGGTLYTFSSASKDLSKTLVNQNIKFMFSKFALLNLPDFNVLPFSDFGNKNNYFQLNTVDGVIFNGGLTGDLNVDFAQSMQNYPLNLENLILSDADYNTAEKKTVAERVFFKWLKECGAMRFRTANSAEKAIGLNENRFVEENQALTGTQRYNKVVQYIGDIDVINNVDKAGQSYTEVYIYVPTQVGNTPTVLFKTVTDANYAAGMAITGQSEYINGRNSSTIHPEGLDTRAYYDLDKQIDYTDPNANWMNEAYPQTIVNAYFTEPTSFDTPDTVEIKKYPADYDDPSGFDGVAYLRSKLDGISIDFDSQSYQQIIADPTISNISQFNGVDAANNFEFNAVLIYYDIYDAANPLDKVTNLYGIMLLDNITQDNNGGYIQRYKKYKPNKVTGDNGNSFGFKVNLRFDASIGSTGVSSIVNESANFATGQFTEAVGLLQVATKQYETLSGKILKLQGQINDLMNSGLSVSSAASLQQQINELETSLQNARLSYSSPTALLDMIAKLNNQVNGIVTGKISTNLQYNTDVLYSGPGINLDKSVPNKIKVTQITQTYNFSTPKREDGSDITSSDRYDMNTTKPQIYLALDRFTNMSRIYTKNSALGDLEIYIDDYSYPFTKGQAVKLVFPDALSLSNRNIIIYTDSTNRKGNGTYGIVAGYFTAASLLSNKPIIELICLDDSTYAFAADLLR